MNSTSINMLTFRLKDCFLLIPYRLAGDTLSLLAVCLSVSLSVSPSHFSFPDFSLSSFEIMRIKNDLEFQIGRYQSRGHALT